MTDEEACEEAAQDVCKDASCGAAFHCPKCGGHYFGTDTQPRSGHYFSTDKAADSYDDWVVICHNQFGTCDGWSGSHKKYVRNDG